MTFETLGLKPALLRNLARLDHTAATPIQTQAIPHVLAGRDLMGLAQTGTGKTAAFGLPLLNRLLGMHGKATPKTARSLILAPTRELAAQIADTLRGLSEGTPVRVLTVVGGASINVQSDKLSRGVDVLVATPGRLLDLMERRAVNLSDTGFLVLDEADQMLDLGFIHALRRIARALPRERQTMLFSATMPKQMEELAATYLKDPIRVQVAPPGKPIEKIAQGVHFVNQGDKATLLRDYLSKHPGEMALVFGRTKHGSEKLMKLLASWGFAAGSIHGNKSQGQRERTLAAFRSGEIQVLVATDVAARGLDIPGVAHVYNYDLPNVPENYVHRIGRTARAGRDGRAVALCAPAELSDLRAIEKAMRAPIPVIGGTVPSGAVPSSPNQPRGAKPATGMAKPRRRGVGRPSRAPGAKSAGKSGGFNQVSAN
jgi:ATP-dependent RNA helicase RhlE